MRLVLRERSQSKAPLQAPPKTLHVAYLEDSPSQAMKIAQLRGPPRGHPCLESFGHQGRDILLYKVDEILEFEILSQKLKPSISYPALVPVVRRHFCDRCAEHVVYLIRKVQGSQVTFAEVPEAFGKSLEATSSTEVALHTDDGIYQVRIVDFDLELEVCRRPLIYRETTALDRGADMLDVTCWQALSRE